MLIPFHDWLLLAAVCVLGAITPGASLAVVLRHTIAHGGRAGATAGVGHALGMGLYALTTVAGLSLLIASQPGLETGITLLGALFLLLLAWQSWHARPTAGTADSAPAKQPFRDGLLIAALNPKVPLFFLALFSPLLSAELGSVARLQLVLTVMLIDGGWYVLVAGGLAGSRLLPWLRHRQQGVNRASAVILTLIAALALSRLI